MKIGKRTVVTIDYTLTDDAGEVLDSSKDSEPLAYVHGRGNIVPGLELALAGKEAGDKISVKVSPEQGYGKKDKELVQKMPRDKFPAKDVEVGMQFEARGEDGAQVVTVVEFDDDSVTVDANHPLAGMTLSFEVTILNVRDATLDELEHGHVHGPEGHGHGGHHHH